MRAERQRDLMALEVRLVVRVAVFGTDVGLSGDQILTAEAETETVSFVGAAILNLQASVGVAALHVQVRASDTAKVTRAPA